jgi:ABC-type polysaccharide/polyol phosphate export permease
MTVSRTFADHLKTDSDRIYTLDPAHSLQVARIAWIGQRVLLFWFGIVCLVATLVPLFRDLPRFVQFVIPTASFFSSHRWNDSLSQQRK